MSTINVNTLQTAAGASPVLVSEIAKLTDVSAVRADLAAPTGSSLMGYMPTGVGAVATTVQGKLRQSVSVLDFGAVGDDVTNNSAAFGLAVAECAASGKDIFVPAGVYVLGSTWAIPFGTSLYGESGTVIKRGFAYVNSSTRALITLAGDNTVDGLEINGNRGAKEAESLTTAQGDICIINGTEPRVNRIIITRCKFRLSRGSSIKTLESGAKNVYITNCLFGEYYDHSVYFAGYPNFSAKVQNVHVSNNVFEYGNADGNTCCKIRNYASKVSFTNNIFNIPKERAFAFDVGGGVDGSITDDGVLDNILVSGNLGTCREVMSCSTALGGGVELAYSHDVLFTGNNFTVTKAAGDSSASYILRDNTDATQYPTGRFVFTSNRFFNPSSTDVTFCSPNGNNAAAYLGKTRYDFNDNKFFGKFNIVPFGTLDLAFTNNFADSLEAASTASLISGYYSVATTTNRVVNSSNKLTICSNELVNYRSLIFDNSIDVSYASVSLMRSFDIIVMRNVNRGNASSVGWIFDIRSDALDYDAATRRVIASENKAAADVIFSSSTLGTSVRFKFFGGDVRLSTAPTIGTWKVGEVVNGSAPAAGGFLGWVCTTAGTPGTWKTFGAISA